MPNIKGKAGGGYWRQPTGVVDGAFTGTASSSGNRGDGNIASVTSIVFDASRSSSIYQDNAHVIPNSTKTKFFIKY